MVGRYAACFLASLAVLAGCGGAGTEPAEPVAGAAADTAGTGTRSAAVPTAARTVDGGCGGTPLLTGPKPPWTASANVGELPFPYAVSDTGNAAAFLFGHPLRAGEQDETGDKILWVVRLPRGGEPLHITGRPARAEQPMFRVTQPANSGPGQIYPSLVTAPEPGCWHLTLRWNGNVDTIDLYYAPDGTAAPG